MKSLVSCTSGTPSRNATPRKNTGKTNEISESNVKCNDRSKIEHSCEARLEHLEAALHHLALAGENELAKLVKLRIIELG